jgi:hypothetical protein
MIVSSAHIYFQPLHDYQASNTASAIGLKICVQSTSHILNVVEGRGILHVESVYVVEMGSTMSNFDYKKQKK